MDKFLGKIVIALLFLQLIATGSLTIDVNKTVGVIFNTFSQLTKVMLSDNSNTKTPINKNGQ
jgi:hypothetical protein